MAKAPFSGGSKLSAKLASIAAKVSNATVVNVGFLEGATYPDLTSVPMVAAINEYGSPAQNIPPRPFFRQMIASESGHWAADTAAALKGADFDAAAALGAMGKSVKGELQTSIANFVGAPLSPKTIARKGFDKQLIDTNDMRNSVAYEVK
jgi:hypothetical protein